MEIKEIKYLGEQALSYLIEKSKVTFALITHKHTAQEIGADEEGAANEAFEAAVQYTDEQITIHTHNDLYYTETEIDNMEFITVDDIDVICGNTIAMASEVEF